MVTIEEHTGFFISCDFSEREMLSRERIVLKVT